MSTEEAVAALDALVGDDQESDHYAADAILLEQVPVEVREAFERARERFAFWYA